MSASRDKQLIDALQTELHNIVAEARKKSPALKLVCSPRYSTNTHIIAQSAEKALLRIRSVVPVNGSLAEGDQCT